MQTLDPNSTALRPLAEYCDRLPSSRRGKKLNRATLWRWALKGERDGRYLRTVGMGSGRFTCDAWVAQFLKHPRASSSCVARVSTPDPVEREQVGRELGAFTDRRHA
jgi:hypothetical protein